MLIRSLLQTAVAHGSPSSTSPRQTQDSPASASGDSWPTEQSTTHELQHAVALPTLPPAQPLHSDPQGLSQGTGKFPNHSGRPSSPATFRVKPSRLSPLDPLLAEQSSLLCTQKALSMYL